MKTKSRKKRATRATSIVPAVLFDLDTPIARLSTGSCFSYDAKRGVWLFEPLESNCAYTEAEIIRSCPTFADVDAVRTIKSMVVGGRA